MPRRRRIGDAIGNHVTRTCPAFAEGAPDIAGTDDRYPHGSALIGGVSWSCIIPLLACGTDAAP